jgi:hypothetical protein
MIRGRPVRATPSPRPSLADQSVRILPVRYIRRSHTGLVAIAAIA